MSEPERISGTVDKLLFHNADNGYSVILVRVSAEESVKTVVGTSQNLREGENIEALGQWHKNPKFGTQFKATSITVITPSSKEGILKYLASGAISGIGPVMAKRIIDNFGDQFFEIMANDPNSLLEINGIGKAKLAKIVESYQEQRGLQDVMVYLSSHNVGTAMAYQIYKKYGNESITKIQENPYRLCRDVYGIGFKIADSIAASIGIPTDSLLRAEAGAMFVMQQIASDGHSIVDYPVLSEKMMEILKIDTAIIATAIGTLLDKNDLANEYPEDGEGEHEQIALKYLFMSEKMIAKNLSRIMLHSTPSWANLPTDEALIAAQVKTGIILAESQAKAVKVALTNKVTVITGGPGVGKTTILNTMLKVLEDQELNIVLCAPTGRAAKRMAEATGMEAATIHRTLEYNPAGGFGLNEDEQLDADIVVVDEGSMLDILLTNALLKAVPDHASVVFLGDIDQLPSVGTGNVLKDIMNSGKVTVVRLTEIFRQAKDSQIVINAHRINNGEAPCDIQKGEPSDFYVMRHDNPENVLQTTLDLVTKRLPAKFDYDPIDDIQVLVPMHKGNLGTQNLNIELQKLLNPPTAAQIKRFNTVFCVGDKVMQTRNNYNTDVFNGDIGRVSKINTVDGIATILFEDRSIEYEMKDLDDLVLAYAMTIHKAQGAEYPCVIMPLVNSHHVMLERNLLYTGITRGKKLVVVNCEPRALKRAIKTVTSRERKTTLCRRIKEACVVSF